MLGKGAKTNISYRNRKRLATLFALLLLVTTAWACLGNTAPRKTSLGSRFVARSPRPCPPTSRTTLCHRHISSPNCP